MVHMFAALKRDAPQGVRASRVRARSSAQQPDPDSSIVLLQVHTLMQQSQAMTAQQLQAFAAQVQAGQGQGQLPGAAASQQAAAGGAQQPGTAFTPQPPQMSGVAANLRSPFPGQLPGAAAPQPAAAGGAQQPGAGAALMPQLPQMSGAAANPRSPSPAQLSGAQLPAAMPAFSGMLRGPGEQLAAPDSSAPSRLPAMQVGQASKMASECMHSGALLHHPQVPLAWSGHGSLCLMVRQCAAGMAQSSRQPCNCQASLAAALDSIPQHVLCGLHKRHCGC